MACSKEECPFTEGTSFKSLLETSNQWAFNFILNTISVLLRCEKRVRAMQSMGLKGGDREISFVGSTFEGFSFSDSFPETPKWQVEHPPLWSDRDIMFTNPLVIVDGDAEGTTSGDTHAYGYSDTSETHPGYLRIALRANAHLIEKSWILDRGLTEYLSSSELFENERGIRDFVTGSADRHGPAHQLQQQNQPDRSSCMLDVVPALKCCAWPAEEWTKRRRLSGWPSPKLIENIVSDGCHVVCKAHALSSEADAEIEFRYSFSVAEVELSRYLSTEQRDCMKLFRLLVLKVAGSGDVPKLELVSSYYLKTVLFWLCEKREDSQWTRDTTGECLLALIDQLLDFLKEGRLPNYFMPENNMIDHLSQSEIQRAVQTIENIRCDPIGHLFSSCSPLHPMFRQSPVDLFKPITDAIDVQDTDLRLRTCIVVTQKAARAAIDCELGWEKGLEYMEEQCRQLLGIQSVQPCLLLVVLFLNDFRDLFGSQREHIWCTSFDDDKRFEIVMEIADFFSAIGNHSAEVEILTRAENLVNRQEESEKVTRQRHAVYRSLATSYIYLDNEEEARKYFHLAHSSKEKRDATQQTNVLEEHLENVNFDILLNYCQS